MDHPYDSVILERTGLTEHEATDFVHKHQAYLDSLSPAQYEATRRSLPSWEDAAKAIDPKMTAKDLQDFVSRRSNKPPVTALCLCFPIIHPPHHS
jgi:hypothetical protein